MQTLQIQLIEEIEQIPEEKLPEIYDLIHSFRLGLIQETAQKKQPIANGQILSSLYLAFEQAGLIGCIETDEQLSTTYKEKLDFSFKHGVTQ